MDRTTEVVQQQIAAMGAQIFEVGLFKPSAVDEGRAVMIPRTWDSNTFIRSIPWLRMQNADGRNIYVRPKGEHNLSLVDDLSADAVKRMKATGFMPAAVVETSPGNFQAWLKHPHQLPRELSTMAARKLAEEFGGDRGAADWRHYGRLAGFTNRKAKYMSDTGLFPFVRLIDASGLPYREGERFAAAISAQRDLDMGQRERRYSPPATTARKIAKSIDDFRSDPRYGGDATREDLAFAIYALSHGRSNHEVASALRSRDLSHKGDEKRQDQYVERTVAKAEKARSGKCLG
ncbi:MAG TPA: RepB family DNA primase [Bryobacteraceae bacterium]|nr:RepB family DNA primase [Bryobacteraceae bacterium]